MDGPSRPSGPGAGRGAAETPPPTAGGARSTRSARCGRPGRLPGPGFPRAGPAGVWSPSLRTPVWVDQAASGRPHRPFFYLCMRGSGGEPAEGGLGADHRVTSARVRAPTHSRGPAVPGGVGPQALRGGHSGTEPGTGLVPALRGANAGPAQGPGAAAQKVQSGGRGARARLTRSRPGGASAWCHAPSRVRDFGGKVPGRRALPREPSEGRLAAARAPGSAAARAGDLGTARHLQGCSPPHHAGGSGAVCGSVSRSKACLPTSVAKARPCRRTRLPLQPQEGAFALQSSDGRRPPHPAPRTLALADSGTWGLARPARPPPLRPTGAEAGRLRGLCPPRPWSAAAALGPLGTWMGRNWSSCVHTRTICSFRSSIPLQILFLFRIVNAR